MLSLLEPYCSSGNQRSKKSLTGLPVNQRHNWDLSLALPSPGVCSFSTVLETLSLRFHNAGIWRDFQRFMEKWDWKIFFLVQKKIVILSWIFCNVQFPWTFWGPHRMHGLNNFTPRWTYFLFPYLHKLLKNPYCLNSTSKHLFGGINL